MKHDSARQTGTGVVWSGLKGNGEHEVTELPFPSDQAMDGLGELAEGNTRFRLPVEGCFI